MKIIETGLEGCWIIEPKVFSDDRGYFFESFNSKTFQEKTGIKVLFVQDNEASSKYGVVRGLHFQKGEHAQAKLVRVFQGAVKDVVLDLRPDSRTFGKHFAVELSGENKLQMFVPKGFAHGYSVLSDSAVFVYKCDELYAPHAEGGIYFADQTLSVDWGIPDNEMVVSDKDLILPSFVEHVNAQALKIN